MDVGGIGLEAARIDSGPLDSSPRSPAKRGWWPRAGPVGERSRFDGIDIQDWIWGLKGRQESRMPARVAPGQMVVPFTMLDET